MMFTGRIAQSSVRIFATCGLMLSLSACATSGLFNNHRDTAAATDPDVVPSYVKNMPKSRTGNMAQYTVFGKQYRVMDSAANFTETGLASWYGRKFHGRKTSSGEVYDMYALTAAHKHLPLPTYVRVLNLENNLSIIVKVNDRGPFVGDRIIDLSLAAAQALDMVDAGTANVRVDALTTHHIADNAATNVVVAQAISGGAVPNEITAEVTAVPISDPLTVVEEVRPETPAGTITENENVSASVEQMTVDTSEDGFVEQPGLALGLRETVNGTLAETVATKDVDATESLAESAMVDSEPLPSGNVSETIVIQLGAFSQKANAQTLVGHVADRTGLPAYVERDGSKALFRVKMGPFQEGELLQSTLAELSSVGIDGFPVKPLQQ